MCMYIFSLHISKFVLGILVYRGDTNRFEKKREYVGSRFAGITSYVMNFLF